MTRKTLYSTIIGALILSAAAFGISAAVNSPRSLMSPVDYEAMKQSIEVDARTTLTMCRGLQDRAGDICKAEARADERIRKADLEAQYRGTVGAAAEAHLARAKAQYEIAKAKCGDQHGEGKFSCLRSARTGKAKALADARLASR